MKSVIICRIITINPSTYTNPPFCIKCGCSLHYTEVTGCQDCLEDARQCDKDVEENRQEFDPDPRSDNDFAEMQEEEEDWTRRQEYEDTIWDALHQSASFSDCEPY